MPRPRRSVARKAPVVETSDSEDIPLKKARSSAPVAESSNDSEDDVPLKKINSSNKPNPKSKAKTHANSDSSSESDIENYLQPVDKIDLNSEFFKVQQKQDNEFSRIEKDIFAGVTRLSDSSDSDAEMEEVKPSIIQKPSDKKEEKVLSQASTSSTKLNFKQLEEYTHKLEEAKRQVEKYNKKKKEDDSKMDISKLLKAGESKQITMENIKAEDLHPSDFESSDDDWEEVKLKENQENKDKPVVSKEGLQIMVDVMPDSVKKKKEVDLLAAMKRRLNRIRKENQIYVHKVHLLCWIAHGNYVNSVLSSTDTLGLALSLLPSDKCYPSDRIDLGYLEQIVQWYRRAVKVEETSSFKDLKLPNALQLQMNGKVAYDKKMFVLIFIAILRALGIQCRLVMSLQVEPLRPPAHELHSLAKECSSKSTKGKKSLGRPSAVKEYRRDVGIEQAKEAMKAREEAHKKSLQQKNIKPEISKKSTTCSKSSSSNRDKEVKVKKDTLPVQDNKTQRSKSTSNNNTKSNSDGKQRSKSTTDRVKDSSKAPRKSTGTTATDIRKEINELKKSNSEEASKRSSNRVTRSKRGLSKEVLQVDGTDDISDDDFMPSPKKLIIQLDGSNDNSSPDVRKKPNLQKLKNTKIKSEQKNRTLKKPALKNLKSKNNNLATLSNPRKPVNLSILTKNVNTSIGNHSKLSYPLPGRGGSDVKSDIINLIKGRISEQKQIDRSRLVKNRKSQYEESESDSDYMPEPIKKKQHDSDSDIEYFIPKPKVKKRIRVKKDPATGKNIVSSESDLDAKGKKKKGVDVWVEVFLEAEEKWISADIVKGQIHCINEIYARATNPISYIIAWNNNNTLKDVTRRYCKSFNTNTRKLRTDPKWWEDTLKPFVGKQSARDKEEDDDINRKQLDQPMPKSVAEYKNHPLYALERHLLKFEAIYPPNSKPLGFVRTEPVYPRNCVYVCKSRDIWLKEAKVVKPGEKPYKIVKARPKWDKLSNKVINGQLLEIFGEWQTMDYDPPTAENGTVPRNAFGNVELFKACMLPKGTVHLKLPGLNKICRRMNIDCASAIVGFDFHGGWSHPTYDGFVICKEFEDQVIAAWELDREEMEKKSADKLEKRVFDNWKKLIKGMLIKEKLKAKYNFGETSEEKQKKPDNKKKT